MNGGPDDTADHTPWWFPVEPSKDDYERWAKQDAHIAIDNPEILNELYNDSYKYLAAWSDTDDAKLEHEPLADAIHCLIAHGSPLREAVIEYLKEHQGIDLSKAPTGRLEGF